MSLSRNQLIRGLYQSRLKVDLAFRSKKLSSLAGIDIGLPQLEILFCLDYFGDQGASIKQLCELTYKTSSAITQLVKGLEKTDHLTRTPSDQDKRVVIVKLTKKGQSHFLKFFESLIGALEKVVEPLSNQELIDLTKIDNKIAEHILKLKPAKESA